MDAFNSSLRLFSLFFWYKSVTYIVENIQIEITFVVVFYNLSNKYVHSYFNIQNLNSTKRPAI